LRLPYWPVSISFRTSCWESGCTAGPRSEDRAARQRRTEKKHATTRYDTGYPVPMMLSVSIDMQGTEFRDEIDAGKSAFSPA